jgi:hypothetical protein
VAALGATFKAWDAAAQIHGIADQDARRIGDRRRAPGGITGRLRPRPGAG